MERLVMTHPRLVGTVLRLPAVYGPGDAQHRLFGYLKRMDDHRPAIVLEAGLAAWRWTRGYVADVGAAIALAVHDERAAGRVYNVGEPQALSEAEWVGAIGAAAGWQGEVLAVSPEQLPEHLRPKIDTAQPWIVDSTRIRRELGYQERMPRPEALRRTIAWERANPPAAIDPPRFDYATEDALLAALGQQARDGGRGRA